MCYLAPGVAYEQGSGYKSGQNFFMEFVLFLGFFDHAPFYGSAQRNFGFSNQEIKFGVEKLVFLQRILSLLLRKSRPIPNKYATKI